MEAGSIRAAWWAAQDDRGFGKPVQQISGDRDTPLVIDWQRLSR
jgi:hypothetical protein